MLFDYCNEKLLGLQDVEVKNIIKVIMILKPHICH